MEPGAAFITWGQSAAQRSAGGAGSAAARRLGPNPHTNTTSSEAGMELRIRGGEEQRRTLLICRPGGCHRQITAANPEVAETPCQKHHSLINNQRRVESSPVTARTDTTHCPGRGGGGRGGRGAKRWWRRRGGAGEGGGFGGGRGGRGEGREGGGGGGEV